MNSVSTRIVPFLQRAEWALNWAFVVFGGFVAFVLMILISVDVAGRYLFGTSLKGTVELSQVMLVMIVFASITYYDLIGGHVKVDLFFARFPRRMQHVVGIFVTGCMALLFAILANQSWTAFNFSWRSHEGTMGELVFPLWIPKLVLFLGFLLFAIHCAGSFLRKLAIGDVSRGELA